MSKYTNFPVLSELNANRARLAALDTEIPKLESLAAKLQNDISLPTSQFCHGAGIHATGSHSDPTARLASQLPADVVELLTDIRSLTIERYRLAARVELAESALRFLPERERMIVTFRIVERMSWEDVADAIYENTGIWTTENVCRKQIDRAMERIAPFFSKSPLESERMILDERL